MGKDRPLAFHGERNVLRAVSAPKNQGTGFVCLSFSGTPSLTFTVAETDVGVIKYSILLLPHGRFLTNSSVPVPVAL